MRRLVWIMTVLAFLCLAEVKYYNWYGALVPLVNIGLFPLVATSNFISLIIS
jgi:hypothetical protein